MAMATMATCMPGRSASAPAHPHERHRVVVGPRAERTRRRASRSGRSSGSPRARTASRPMAMPWAGRRRRCGRGCAGVAARVRGAGARRGRAARRSPRGTASPRAAQCSSVAESGVVRVRASKVTAAASQSASHTARSTPAAVPRCRSVTSSPASTSSPLGVRPGTEAHQPLGRRHRAQQPAGGATGGQQLDRVVAPPVQARPGPPVRHSDAGSRGPTPARHSDASLRGSTRPSAGAGSHQRRTRRLSRPTSTDPSPGDASSPTVTCGSSAASSTRVGQPDAPRR